MRVIDRNGLVYDSMPDELYHHGILGMKWGKKNGPPYPLGASDHSAAEKKAGWRKSLDKDGDTQTKRGAKIYTKQINKLEKQKAKATYEAMQELSRNEKLSSKANKNREMRQILDDINESYNETLEYIKDRTGSDSVQVNDDVQFQYIKEKLKEYKHKGYNTKTLERLTDSTRDLMSKTNKASDIEKKGKELVQEAIDKGYSIDSKTVSYQIDAGKDMIKWMFFLGIGSTNAFVMGDKYKVKKTKDNEYQSVTKDGEYSIVDEKRGRSSKDSGHVNDEEFDGYAVRFDDDGNILSVKDKNGSKTTADKMLDDLGRQEEKRINNQNKMSSQAKSLRSSGMSYAQIAKKLGIPESSVGYYLNL